MLLDPSLEEDLESFYNLYVDSSAQISLPTSSMRLAASPTPSQRTKTERHGSLITTPPELRVRNPVPEPQNGPADCSQAAQSASQAIQQATQQASQSISQAQQQASQSVSQAQREAAQSASQAIQQLSISASQSIAAASRSASAASQSASFAIASASSQVASIQSSAEAAISRANGSMMNAQASATIAQAQASAAVLQAGAAVAAATGSAAAAGSSFLAAAAKATQSAQASVSAIGAQASQQVTASQIAAITATQAALAIVGSIIASALITILIFFLVSRHRKSAKRKRRGHPSLGNVYFSDPKGPIGEQKATTANQQQGYNGTQDLGPMSGGSLSTFAAFPKDMDEKAPVAEGSKTSELRRSLVKRTVLPWNPNKPPKAPTLGSWLKLQDGVSPFGPIKLPLEDEKYASPLGGQLKSPMTTKSNLSLRSPGVTSGISIATTGALLAPTRIPTLPVLISNAPTSTKQSSITAVPQSPLTLPVEATSPRRADTLVPHSTLAEYRESKASVWTDDIPDLSPSPPLQSPPPELRTNLSERKPINSIQKLSNMEIPALVNPVRNTAEWFAERARLSSASVQRDSKASEPRYQLGSQGSAYSENKNNNSNLRPSYGMPRGPRAGGGMVGLPTRPGPSRQRSSEVEVGYVQGLNRFLPENGQRGSTLSRNGSNGTNASTPGGRSMLNTPGVGKAL